MKKLLLTISLLYFGITLSQTNRQFVKEGFDENQALQEAKKKGLAPIDYAGYVKHKYNAWLKQNGTLSPAFTKPSPATARHSHNTVMAATNIDFESGNYTGWQLFSGENTTNSNGPLASILPMNPGIIDSINCNMPDTSMRQALMTSASIDPESGLSLSSPLGGNYVARVNRLCANYEGSIVSQTFPVTAGQTVLNYVYAVILTDGGHAWGEQPYMQIKVLDQTGGLIDSVYMQAANGTTPGFYPTTVTMSTYYKPWTPVSVDVSAYLGQNITLEITAAGCIWSGHGGYGYFDARMDSVSAIPNVWPGDANYDLTADMNDLLYLGWAYGATGTTRSAATINWQAEPSANWGQTTVYGTEYKHADCNGDGTVDDNDTTAILQNYGLQHVFKMAAQNEVAALSNYRNLVITPNVSTVGPNQTLTLGISIPTTTLSVPNDLYGIAFRLTAPSQYIASLSSSDFSNSFLGVKGSTMMTLVKAEFSQDHVDFCLVRKDHQNSTAGGTLFDLNLLTSNFSSNGAHNFTISSVKAISHQGDYLPIGSVSAMVNFSTTTAIQKSNAAEVRIVPNPATDKVIVDGLNEKVSFEIINVIGQPVLKSTLDTKKTIDVSAFEKGAYFIKLITSQGTLIKKFIKE